MGPVLTPSSPARSIAIWASIGIFALLVGLCHFTIQAERNRLSESLRNQASSAAVGLSSRLEAELNASVYLATGLAAYVNAARSLSEDEIQKALESPYRTGRHIRNIGLAPGNRLSYVYPLQGNEAALGLYYPDMGAQWPAVKRAIETRQTVLAGPVDLRQGGRGLISRTPVFLSDGAYWGLLSLVMDSDSLFTAAGLNGQSAPYRFALRGKDGLGEDGPVIYGDPGLFERDSIELTLAVPGGNWRLAVRPERGWTAGQGYLEAIEAVAIVVSGLLAMAAYLYQNGRARLTSSERRLRLFMDTTLDGVIVLDESGRVIEFNPAAERLFGYTGDEIVGGPVNRLMPEADAQRHNDYIRRVSTGDSRAMSSSREVMGLRKDGSQFPIEVTVAEARDGESLVHIGVVRDISERRAFEQQLLALATTDSLTGALNRRAFLETGEDVFRRSVRYRHPLSVLAIDVDHFKRINDTFGHPIGDEVLIDLVSRIGENLRETDVFGRFGGEEFVVLLSEADEQRAIEVADRLLSVIRAADRVSMEGTPVRYTISIGIASAGEGGLGLNDVIHAADRALYNAKNAGRDRYRVAT